MPYKDPAKRRQARRESDRRRRERERAERVEAARLPDGSLPEPPDRDELLALLGVAARNGSVTAMRMLLERSEAADEGAVGSVVGDLAQRRRERAAKNPFEELDVLSPPAREIDPDDENEDEESSA